MNKTNKSNYENLKYKTFTIIKVFYFLENVPLLISVRGLIGLMAFFSYFILNSQRANMGITILCIYPKSNSSSNSTNNTSLNERDEVLKTCN
jgi:hypothetical protein